MPRTRIVLHIGMPNAGSSAVQYGLWRYRRELAARGLHYYTGGKTPRLISSGNGKDLAGYLNPKRRGPDFSEAAFEGSFAKRFLSPGHAVSLVSAEQLAGSPAEHLERFRDGLAAGHEVRVVAFIRDIYGHARSCWMQQIKRKAYVHGFERFASEAYDDMQCRSALKFGRVFGFGAVTLIHLDGLKGDLFETFLGAIGIPGGLEPLPQVNRGLSPAEVRVLRLCNRIHRSGEWATLISDHLLEARPQAPRAAAWSPRIAAELEARVRHRIDQVNARYFPHAPGLRVGGEPPPGAPPRESRLAVWAPVLSAMARAGLRRLSGRLSGAMEAEA